MHLYKFPSNTLAQQHVFSSIKALLPQEEEGEELKLFQLRHSHTIVSLIYKVC